MIALCQEHAAKADNGSFTDEQLRELKAVGAARAGEVRGRFDWMRQKILGVIGGIFYYETQVLVQVGTVRTIWFERDMNGYLLLNVRMPTTSGSERARVENN